MPRYFFDIRNGADSRDDTGTDLPSPEIARAEAIKLLPDVAREELRYGDGRVVSVTVRDMAGVTVFGATLTLHCSKLRTDS